MERYYNDALLWVAEDAVASFRPYESVAQPLESSNDR